MTEEEKAQHQKVVDWIIEDVYRRLERLERLEVAESLLRRALLQPESDPALVREIREFLKESG
jgi:hypothetical protein